MEKAVSTRREVIKAMVATLVFPALPMSSANAITHKPSPDIGCDAEFPYFGARYPDARCIDGWLWDLDSCDGSGEDLILTSGGDWPCPYCNARKYLEYVKDEIEEKGWIAFCDGESPMDNPYLKGSRFPHMTDQFQRMWFEGYRSASLNAEAIEDRKGIG